MVDAMSKMHKRDKSRTVKAPSVDETYRRFAADRFKLWRMEDWPRWLRLSNVAVDDDAALNQLVDAAAANELADHAKSLSKKRARGKLSAADSHQQESNLEI